MRSTDLDITLVQDLSVVRIRVPVAASADAAKSLEFPIKPMHWIAGDPDVLWIAPDQWLLTSRSQAPDQLLSLCRERMKGILHHAVDVSDALTCVSVAGRRARLVLAMLGGADYSAEAFPAGICTRTRMGKVAVVVKAMSEQQMELLVDRSVSRDLLTHLECASRDSTGTL